MYISRKYKTVTYENRCQIQEMRELLRLIEVGASCFNHYCVGCGVTQLNVLHNVHRRISLG